MFSSQIKNTVNLANMLKTALKQWVFVLLIFALPAASAAQQESPSNLAVTEFVQTILSRSGSPPIFRLDLYHPAQSGSQPIATTTGINAGRLCVDFWRSVYTLNYEVLKLPSGQVPALTEPSVSLWLPRSLA